MNIHSGGRAAVARQAHNLQVVRSNRTPATNFNRRFPFMDFPSPFDLGGMFSPESVPSHFSPYTDCHNIS